MYRCQDCGSDKVVLVDRYQAYFREGEYVRLRYIDVWRNDLVRETIWMASCSEKDPKTVGTGNTKLEAILDLGDKLEALKLGSLLGRKLEE